MCAPSGRASIIFGGGARCESEFRTSLFVSGADGQDTNAVKAGPCDMFWGVRWVRSLRGPPGKRTWKSREDHFDRARSVMGSHWKRWRKRPGVRVHSWPPFLPRRPLSSSFTSTSQYPCILLSDGGEGWETRTYSACSRPSLRASFSDSSQFCVSSSSS